MGWLARSAVISATLLVGCASIAGISDETAPTDPETRGANVGNSGGSSGSKEPSGTGQSPESGVDVAVDASVGDSATEADAPAPGCTKKADGVSCETKGECCADGCNEAKECGRCLGSFSVCDPSAGAPCCTGFFCSTGIGVPTCQGCVLATGTPKTQPFGGGVKSCCSRKVGGDGKCL
jgi:hypothetical protein